MKLQSRVNRRIGNKEYRKWYIDIPPDVIEKIGWKESLELDYDVKNHQIVLRPKKKKSN